MENNNMCLKDERGGIMMRAYGEPYIGNRKVKLNP
jgi:hypothetical protein